jgi:hypothetical protein
VVGGIVVLLAFILLAFFLRRRRHRQEKSYHPVSLPLPSTPALPMQRSTTASRTSYRYMRVPKTVPASRFRNVSEVSFSPLRSATDAMDENSSPDVVSRYQPLGEM